jgi:hypothetical protein
MNKTSDFAYFRLKGEKVVESVESQKKHRIIQNQLIRKLLGAENPPYRQEDYSEPGVCCSYWNLVKLQN